MNEWFWRIRGITQIKITGASPQWALNRLARMRIAFWGVCWIDAVTVQLQIFRRDQIKAQVEIRRAMCDSVVVGTEGLREEWKAAAVRPVLMFIVVLSFTFAMVLSQFVLFYEVTGNETVPDAQILRTLDSIGVGFGTYGPSIKPKVIKDHVLNMLPQLEWITITQNGCRAQVVVRERSATPETETRKGYGNIVAARSGIITQQNIFAGQPMFEVGEAVLEGEILVSGAVDLERIVVLRKASAEIFAVTGHQITAKIPVCYGEKVHTGLKMTSLWLTIGEKRIKIFGNSGIYTTNCDKMIETKKLTLPGGLELPVILSVETVLPYSQQTALLTDAAAQLLLQAYAEETVQNALRAGEIMRRQYELQQENGCYVLQTQMECQEMIALPMEADWIKED